MIKRIISLLIAVSILSVGVSVSADYTGLTNLALGKTVTSSVSRGTNITDGSKSVTSADSTWYATNAKARDLVIDLEEDVLFNTLLIYEYNSQRITGYKIEASSNNSDWETVLESRFPREFARSTLIVPISASLEKLPSEPNGNVRRRKKRSASTPNFSART